MAKRDILSMTLPELSAQVEVLGQPGYRSRQIFGFLHNKLAGSFDEMTNLPKSFRAQLDDSFVILGCTIEKKLVSCYDNTVKYLFRLNDGEYIECVVMRYKYGLSVCVSTQVGCAMGCKFCATGIGGFVRDLKPAEMLSQVYAAQRDLGERISHIVLMGMGEPLLNYDNVLRFLELVSDPLGLNIGMRNISVSTCGIVDRIYDLAELDLQITLSVSLHAPSDEIRSALMPVNNKWGVDELLKACVYYEQKTGRRISFEYSMINGVNDGPEAARLLGKKLSGTLCHVNLIPVNEVKETGMRAGSRRNIESFKSILESYGLTVTVRRTLGSDINASCGQLRRKARGES